MDGSGETINMDEMDQEFWNESYKQDAGQSGVPGHFLKNEIENLAPGSAVDLGCGVGDNVLMLAERDWRVTGVDWAEEAINIAQETAREKGLKARFVVADSTNWEPPHKYDLVITTFALPGGDASGQVLATAAKSLATRGTLIVIEWDKSMAEVWGFSEDDLMSVNEIIAALPGLEIEKAEIGQVESPFEYSSHDQGAAKANVALVRARGLS